MKETNIYDSINEDTLCPVCFKNRFWLKFYCGKTILWCADCGYFIII